MPKTKQEQEARLYWSQGGQILFYYGKAYGLAPDSKTIYLGTEAEILKTLDEKKAVGNPTIDNILRLEINNRGKQDLVSRATTRRHRLKNRAVSPLR